MWFIPIIGFLKPQSGGDMDRKTPCLFKSNLLNYEDMSNE